MASTQKQKKVSGGSVAGSLSAAWPGLPAGVASAATMRDCLPVLKRSSNSRQAGACSRTSLLLFPERPDSNTLSEQRQSGKVIALDASEAMLDVARSKIEDPRVSFVQGDVRHLPFADDTFDLAARR